MVEEQQSQEAGAAAAESVQRRRARERSDKSYSAPRRSALNCAALRLAARLPLGGLHALGTGIGRMLGAFPTRERAATRVNLRLCFPELSDAERAQLERASLIHTGRTVAELAGLWCWRPEHVLALVRETRGEEAFLRACERGGVLLLTPHLGAWELSGLYVATRAQLTALYKPPLVHEMEDFYTAARQRTGARLVPADSSGVRALHRALREGQVAGILPDQDPGRGSGLFAPFFGVQANTTTLVAKLLEKTGVPLFLCWSERLAQKGFRVHFVEALDPELHSADVSRAVGAMNLALERLIRSRPDQYLWSYKRFRYRPPGEANPYRLGEPEAEG